MREATERAVQAIKDVGQTIALVREVGATIASAVEEQGAMTSEIARNVQDGASGSRIITEQIIRVSDAAGATGRAASAVLERLRITRGCSEELGQEIDHFLGQVLVEA